MASHPCTHLGELFKSSRKKGEEGLPLLSVTLNNGLIVRDQLDRRTETNLEASEHLLVQSGDIAYNMMRVWQGALGRASVNGLVSPAYVVLRPTAKIDSLYAEYLFKNPRMIYLFWAYSYGLTKDRLRLYFNDFSRIPVTIPDLKEQRKIAQTLSTWDKAITTTEQLLANSQQQKKALMQQLLTGKKRLLDKNGVRFSGEWRFLTFDEAFKVANKKSAQVKSSDYLATGSVPVVDQGKELIAGYCNNDERYTNVPVIIFGDHTRCLKWVDFEFCPGADGTQVLDSKEFLDKKFGYYLLCHTDIPNLGYSRHMRELKEKDFKVPVDMIEQQKIAAVLSTADQEISALKQKLDALKQEKKALMQQLLTGKRRVKIDNKEVA